MSPTPSLEQFDSSDECVICSDNQREIVFQPCGHAVACEPCGSRVKKCLLCRSTVVNRTKVRNYKKSITFLVAGKCILSVGFV